MLTSVFRAQVKDLVKKSFYRKRKKTINVLTVFFISHKSDVKTFLKWILNSVLRALVCMTQYIYIYIHTHGWYLLLNSLAVYLAIHDGYVMKDCMDVNDS